MSPIMVARAPARAMSRPVFVGVEPPRGTGGVWGERFGWVDDREEGFEREALVREGTENRSRILMMRVSCIIIYVLWMMILTFS